MVKKQETFAERLEELHRLVMFTDTPEEVRGLALQIIRDIDAAESKTRETGEVDMSLVRGIVRNLSKLETLREGIHLCRKPYH